MYIIYDDFYLKHDTGFSHPENPGRLEAIKFALERYDLKEKLNFITPLSAGIERVAAVHSERYIENVKFHSENDAPYYLDPDTIISEHTYECAMLAAGGCICGVDLILDDSVRSSESIFFALVRPPGHHAFRAKGTGFCIFNNIAISATHAISGYNLERIAIIDFDVHHGNGTQNIFYENPRVFYISLHQYPHYPGSGYLDETGSGSGEGFNMNIPLQPFSGEADYMKAFVDIVIPVLSMFKPQLVLVSAGFDGHAGDPLSYINLTAESFYRVMHSILFISRNAINHGAGGKCSTGIVLEGGYNHDALANSVIRVIDACLEEDMHSKLTGKNALIDFLFHGGMNVSGISPVNIENFERIKKQFHI